MLYAIVSDLHSNLVAWKAVLSDLASCKAGKIICLGDIVGYGPEPAAILESVYRHVDAFVMGNHDAAISGKMSPENFNDFAKSMVEWSASRINARGREFLGSNPLTISAHGFLCAHGSPFQPQAFPYIVDAEEARRAWGATDAPLIFVGHSHIPSICVVGESGTARWIAPQDFVVDDGRRFIVNTGSVGDPRDGDPRASYCLYDDETRTVRFRRVSFDYDALAAATVAAGLDPAKMPMLRRDPVPTREAVREALGFAPPTDESAMVQDATINADLDSLKRTNRRLKTTIILAVLAVIIAVAGAVSALRHASVSARRAQAAAQLANGVSVPDAPLDPLVADAAFDPDRNLLPPFKFFDLAPYPQVYGWRYTMENPAEQSVGMPQADPRHGGFLRIRHTVRHAISLEAPDWIVGRFAGGKRVKVGSFARRNGDFSGTATIFVVAHGADGSETTLISIPLALNEALAWKQKNKTQDKKNPAIAGNVERISYRIAADFAGELDLAGLTLNVIE